jgi:hypothetical protein
MGEGLEDVDEQRIGNTFPLPPLPGLSVIKEANVMQETPAMIHHQLCLTQERLSNVNDILNPDMENNKSFQPSNVHPQFTSDKCQWIGYETHCQTFHGFLHHLQNNHHLCERSAAQTKVQMVDQLEKQVVREKARLLAMVEHFKASEAEQTFHREKFDPVQLFMLKRHLDANHAAQSSHLRRTSKEDDLYETFSRSEDARPPHTYAALIRMVSLFGYKYIFSMSNLYSFQAILESHNQQLTN